MRFATKTCAPAILLAVILPAHSQTSVWTNSGVSSWYLNTNWSDNTIPTSASTVVLDTGTAFIPSSTAQADQVIIGLNSPGSLRIDTGATLANAGAVIDKASTADIAGGTWTFSLLQDSLWIGDTASGSLTLRDNGTIRLNNGNGWISLGVKSTGTGTLNIGASSGSASVAPGKINGTQVTTGLGTGTVVLNHSSTNYYLTSTGASGGAPIALNGALNLRVENGTTILKTTAAHTGGTTFKGGTLRVESGGVLGNNSNSLTVANASGETGTLVLADGGKATSTLGTIGFSSGSSGTVLITGSGSEWTTTNNGLPLVVGRSGTGSLTLQDGGRITLAGAAGDIDLGALAAGNGTLNIGAPAAQAAAAPGMANVNSIYKGSGSGTVVFNHTSSDYWMTKTGASAGANVLLGSGLTVRQLAGVTNLKGSNTYSGGTIVDGGELIANSAGALPQNTAYTVNGGILRLGSNNLTASSLSGTGGQIALDGSAFTVNQSANTTFAGQFFSPNYSVIRKLGSGELKLTGSGFFYGTLSASGGSVVIAASQEFEDIVVGENGFGVGSLSVSGAGALLTASSRFVVGGGLHDSSSTDGVGTLNISDGGTVAIVNGIDIGSDGATGTVNLNLGGTLQVGGEDAIRTYGTGTFNLNGGTLQVTNNSLTTSTPVTLTGASSTVDTNGLSATFNQPLSGSGGFTKTGGGDLILNAANTYSGTTTISAGTLILGEDASISQSSRIDIGTDAVFDVSTRFDYTIGAAQTLSGTGSVRGNIFVDGTLAPGNSTGTLSFDYDVSINSGGAVRMELAGANDYDRIFFYQEVQFGGTLSISFLNGFNPTVGQSFQIFHFFDDEVGGAFTNIQFSSPGYAANLDYLTGNLTFTAIPEPSSTALLTIGVLAIGIRIRRKSHR